MTAGPDRRPLKDPATGRFISRDPTKARKRKRRAAAAVMIPDVERRAIERIAERGVRGGHMFAVGQRARRHVEAAFDSLVAELGDKATASTVALAERIALRIVELRHWDRVLAEMRDRNLLVDRRRKKFAEIQLQYQSLQAELRADLDVFARMKQSATVDQFYRELQELRSTVAGRVVNRPSPTPEDY